MTQAGYRRIAGTVTGTVVTPSATVITAAIVPPTTGTIVAVVPATGVIVAVGAAAIEPVLAMQLHRKLALAEYDYAARQFPNSPFLPLDCSHKA
jgi:hypothetical protein